MLRYIFSFAKKEVFSNLYSVRFIFTMDLICVLFLVSAFMMLSDYRARRTNYEAKRKVHQDGVMDILTEEDSRDQARKLFWWEGLTYDRQPVPMSVFVKGLDLQTPITFTKSSWEEKQSNDDVYRNPILKLYMSPDFAYIVNIILSLLALLFVFDNICGEKEDGTLKLVLSYPVPKVSMLLGKWIGGFLTLLAPFFVSVLFWMVIITNSGDVSFDPENVIRFFTIILTSICYLALFFSLGMFISVLTHYSNTALLVCFFVWVIWIIVIPNAAPVAAKVVAPIPSRQEIEELKKGVDETIQRKIKDAEKTILSYSDELEDRKDEIKQKGEAEKNHIEAFYDTRVKKQSRVSGFLARLSPSGSYIFAVTAVAGTGLDTYNNVQSSYEKFKDDFHTFYQRHRRWWEFGPGWLEYGELPRLHFTMLRLEDIISKAMFDILLLMVYSILFFMLAFLGFLVYDPK